MSNRWFLSLLLLLPATTLTVSVAQAGYGARVCKQKQFKCHKVKKGETWASLFPSSHQREVAHRLNRKNNRLKPGQVIAIPKNAATDLIDVSPFPSYITDKGQFNRIYVNQRKLAWGAYDAGGKLIKWGPISAGRSYCRDIKGSCKTPSGTFTAFRKKGSGCESTTFPVGKGGSPMPYCIFFNKGIALHGSDTVPGYNASHGCVRLFTEDARWLNYSFVELGGTKVVVSNKIPKRTSSSQYKKPKSRLTDSFTSGWNH